MVRRVLATGAIGTVALAMLLGPGAALAHAADDDTAPAPTLSATSVRAGTSFTVTPPQSCPSAYGQQGVLITYSDAEDTTYQLGLLMTDDNGNWGPATVRLPVTGPDGAGGWDPSSVTAGTGTVDVLCLSSEYVTAAAPATFSSLSGASSSPTRLVRTAPDDDGDSDDGDDADDGTTLTYAPAALTSAGRAARISAKPALAQPGDSLTVAPVDVCGAPATTARIQVSPVALADDDPGDSDDDGSGDGDTGDDSDDIDGLGAGADPSAVATTEVDVSNGTWGSTRLPLPDDAPLGDYGITVDCLDSSQEISSRYESAPLALGTLKAAAPVCSAKGATVRLTGTYPGTLATGTGDETELPSTLKLSGTGPWNVALNSALTDGALLRQKVACPEPDYELTVTKPSVTSKGLVRARICNTGDGTVTALLQVAGKNRKFATVERTSLNDGDCAWLDGGKVKRGGSASARVVLDPVGKGTADQEVATTFTVRRKG
ncbi:hypothetical protein [Kineosporia succinea]|uniref:Secreted protein n=1 Tax=Kineosporia succinea TaxID=84632 RepID=A0ABT9P0C0_9ACTN|nr:hypothetical protein [Kineosporia succinea]MDP9826120.1 hypothetical protein [Kineosporia succinea]